ncbi:MAG: DUF664 domain-containing protein [Phycisphaerales bacterium]|nr:DinB family protein [Phycisphaerae bacterium]NNM26616.1 DUF664 domain-containing protein [Phycisphaerales bacterium]
MRPARIYDYLVRSRARVLEATRGLPASDHARVFPIGLGTIGRTLTHIMISEWYYVQRMQQRVVPVYEKWPIRDEHPPPLATLEAAWRTQADETRAAIATLAGTAAWEAALSYEPEPDEGKTIVVTASPADIFTQLVLHEVHHRAQALNMLRQLGASAGEIDCNAMMYDQRDIPAG